MVESKVVGGFPQQKIGPRVSDVFATEIICENEGNVRAAIGLDGGDESTKG